MSLEQRRNTMHRTIILVVVSTIISAALAVAAPARAAAPVHERVVVDSTVTFDFCGFPVEESLKGTLQTTSWFDESGNRTRETVTAPGLRITWTNGDTGASVSSGNPFVVHKTDNADGSVTVMFTGLGWVMNSGGSAYVSSGRAVLVFSEAGVELLAASGPNADLCEALAATIG
jgi:hypothetical protein